MSDFDLVIFDCDGVLVESEWIACAVESEVFTRLGAKLSPEDVHERYMGQSLDYMYNDVSTSFDIEIDRVACEAASKKLFWERAQTDLTCIDGVREFIATLDHKRCVCSNSGLAHVLQCIAHTGIEGLPEAHCFSSQDHGRGKPSPDVFLHAAGILDVEPSRCLVIEDSLSGVKGGVAAGMTVTGFVGGRHCKDGHGDGLVEAGAQFATTDWNDIKKVLK